jgi:hypothetical protein
VVLVKLLISISSLGGEIMYLSKHILAIAVALLLALFIGCSAGDAPVAPENTAGLSDSVPVIGLADVNNALDALGLFGAYDLTINPNKMTADLVTKRTSTIGESYIVSGMGFFTSAPCPDCLNLSTLRQDGMNFIVSFNIRHPFKPGNIGEDPTALNRLDLDVFDLAMLVVPVEETPSEYTGTGVSIYSDVLSEPDGYTTELANVIEDNAAIPYALVVDDSITGESTWNKFAMGDETEFDVSFPFTMGETLSFELYLTMGYGFSAVKADRLHPAYFNPEFNRKSPWKIDVIPPQAEMPPEIGNTWSDNDPETEFEVTVLVYDWQIDANVNSDLELPTDVYAASNIDEVEIEIIGMNLASVDGMAHDGTGTGMADRPLVYHIPIMNEGLLTAGEYTGLVKVTDERAVGTIGDRDFLIDSPDGVELVNYEMIEYVTYQTFPVTVVIGLPGWIVIQQIDYSFEDETVTDSAFGNVRVNFMDDPAVKYFNLTVESGWVIQNMPLVSWKGPGFIHSVNLSFDLNVPDGTDVSMLNNVGWSIDNGIQLAGPLGSGSVYVYTGIVTGYIGRIPSTFGFPFFPDNPKITGAGPPGICVGPYYPNKECGNGECVPAAVSNSLEYLQGTQGEPPWGTLTSIDTMKDATGWVSSTPTSSAGCPQGWADTKDQYMSDNGYNIETEQYPDPDNMHHEATEAECDSAMAAVNAGDDVEINGGHHTAVVNSIVKGTDANGDTIYTISVRHDTRQGEPGGCQSETIVYKPPQNGNPSETTGGSPGFFDGDDINGFVSESAST